MSERMAEEFDDRELPPTVASTPEPAAGSDADFVGRVLGGRYRIISKLGEGAMGAVYLGEHMKIGRRDAIKVLRQGLATDPDTIARFVRGTRNVAMIRHPNICTIYDYSDLAGDTQFVAMEYVAGRTLRELLDDEPRLPMDVAVHIACQAADALQAAHEVGIVHRDLKPANIMVVPNRAGSYDVKVVDFDIAKGSSDGEGEEVTRMGFVVGTPEYMSPEQLIGDRLDGRSDVYSLALVLFRMLTGTLPFVAEDTQDLMVKRLTEQPMKLLEFMPGAGYPPALEAAIHRALQRKPADRQASAAEFRQEVAAAAVGAVGAQNLSHAAGGAVPGGWSATEAAARTTAAPLQPAAATAAGASPVVPEAASAAAGDGSARPASRRGWLYGGAVGVVAAIAVVALLVTREQGAPAGEALTQTTEGLAESGGSMSAPADPAATGLSADVTPAVGSGGSATPLPAAPGSAAGSSGGGVSGSPPIQGGDAAPAAGISPAVVTRPPLSDDEFYTLLDRLGPPAPSRAALLAVRDTAVSAWAHPGATAAQRAFAAYVAANALIPLGDTAQAIDWLERSVELRPNYAPYRDLLRGLMELYEAL